MLSRKSQAANGIGNPVVWCGVAILEPDTLNRFLFWCFFTEVINAFPLNTLYFFYIQWTKCLLTVQELFLLFGKRRERGNRQSLTNSGNLLKANNLTWRHTVPLYSLTTRYPAVWRPFEKREAHWDLWSSTLCAFNWLSRDMAKLCSFHLQGCVDVEWVREREPFYLIKGLGLSPGRSHLPAPFTLGDGVPFRPCARWSRKCRSLSPDLSG